MELVLLKIYYNEVYSKFYSNLLLKHNFGDEDD
jgi:hypothetical protein